MELKINYNKPYEFQGQLNMSANCTFGTHTRTFGVAVYRENREKRSTTLNKMKTEISNMAIAWAKELRHKG